MLAFLTSFSLQLGDIRSCHWHRVRRGGIRLLSCLSRWRQSCCLHAISGHNQWWKPQVLLQHGWAVNHRAQRSYLLTQNANLLTVEYFNSLSLTLPDIVTWLPLRRLKNFVWLPNSNHPYLACQHPFKLHLYMCMKGFQSWLKVSEICPLLLVIGQYSPLHNISSGKHSSKKNIQGKSLNFF